MQYLPIIVCDLGHSVIYANTMYIFLNFQISLIRIKLIPGKSSVISSYFQLVQLFVIN